MTEPARPPAPADRPGPGGRPPGEPPARTRLPRDRAWPWLLTLVLALAAGVLLAWRPWAPAPAPGAATPDATASTSPTSTAEPSPTATSGATSGTGGFDADSAPALFLTDAELADAVPMAAGQSLADAPEAQWGLPERSTVDPSACTPAVTTTEREPGVFLRRFASDDAVTVIQSVLVLADDAAAQEAFDVLVGTLEDCDAYQQTDPGTDGGAWTADPPTTDRGAVPTVVRALTLSAEGATSPEVEVTALAGNALVTTTASGVDPAAEPADPGTLAGVARSSAERALDGLG